MTKEITLRDVTEADLSIFFEQQLDADATRMAAFTARDREAFMSHWAKIMADPSILIKAVLCNGQVAGNVVSFEIDGEREVGYWLGKEFWGKGIATQALAEFLGHIETRPLYAHVARHNIASRRVLEKCGFLITGEDRSFSNWGGQKIEGFILKLE
jgi:RimJ/RimL family protein N-acetyltransferase